MAKKSQSLSLNSLQCDSVAGKRSKVAKTTQRSDTTIGLRSSREPTVLPAVMPYLALGSKCTQGGFLKMERTDREMEMEINLEAGSNAGTLVAEV